jgi:ribosomal protein S18 acetylase RimI-like enzyme
VNNRKVGKEFQGNGIGKMLVKSALSYIKDSGGDNAKIETQIQNISAIRAYASCGFKAIETYLTFAWSKSSR